MVGSCKLRKRVSAGLVACAVAASTAVVAVGPSPASAESHAVEAPGVIKAKKMVKFLSTYPTKIGITVPLTKRPPRGLKVFYVGPANVDSKRLSDGFSAAAVSLGWIPTVLNWTTNQADTNGLVQQAIQAGAAYVTVNGVDIKLIQPALDAGRAANVPIILNAGVGVPLGKVNWLFASVLESNELVYRGITAAAQTVANSNGKANTLIMNVPQLPIFVTWAAAYKEEYARLCPGCILNGEVNSPLADIFSGKAGSAGVAYLRANPEVNQVTCANGNFCQDFLQKLATSGITGIGISTSGVSAALLPMIAAGTVQSSTASPLEYIGWQVVDAMARLSVKNSVVPNIKARIPLYVFTKANTTPTSQMYAGPTNYTGQFKKLWKVS